MLLGGARRAPRRLRLFLENAVLLEGAAPRDGGSRGWPVAVPSLACGRPVAGPWPACGEVAAEYPREGGPSGCPRDGGPSECPREDVLQGALSKGIK